MPIKESFWTCKICRTRYPYTDEGKELASKCEALGKPKKKFKVGQRLNLGSSVSGPNGGVNKVIDVYRALHQPKRGENKFVHIVKVKLESTISGAIGVWHQATLEDYIASGKITLVE